MNIKVVLSRKGCDTVTGKISSIIIDKKDMFSIPIPISNVEMECYQNHSNKILYKYEDLPFNLTKDTLKKYLTNHESNEKIKEEDKWKKAKEFCHYDPDLIDRSMVVPKWKPSLGQCGPNASMLKNACDNSDVVIFLFFGRFHHVYFENGNLLHVKKSNNKLENVDIQVIWGYLIVNPKGEGIIKGTDIKEKFPWHPHAVSYYSDEDNVQTKNIPNIIFTGNGGILNYDEARVLTLKERKNNKPIASAIWDPDKFKCDDAIIKKNINQDKELYLRGRWQERVMNFVNIDDLNIFLKSFNLEFKEDKIWDSE